MAKTLLIFLFSFVTSGLLCQDFSPTYAEIEETLQQGNDEACLNKLLQKIKKLESSPKRDLLLLSHHYNLIGKIYHSQSDIDEAKMYWDKSLGILKTNYNLNNIQLAETYSLISKYYSFRIIKDSAYYFAKKSIEICRQNKDSIRFIAVNEIYREFAYALKIIVTDVDFIHARRQSKVYLDSAIYYNKLYFSDNLLFKTQVYHDIGNLYNDKAYFYQLKLNDHQKSIVNFKLANSYYDKCLFIRKNKLKINEEKIAKIYFVKSLAYRYTFEWDSLNPALHNLQNGLNLLNKKYANEDAFAEPNPNSKFTNPAFALTILSSKINAFYLLFLKTKDIRYIINCYEHSKFAVNIYQSVLKSIKTKEPHKALEVYDSSPFNIALLSSGLYYQLSKNNVVKENVINWIGMHKYASLQKDELLNSAASISTLYLNASQVQLLLKDNECIVDYHVNGNFTICATTTKKIRELNFKITSFNVEQMTDSINYALTKHDATSYCKLSKILYDSLLVANIKDLPKNINHLIIMPHGKLAKVPFDALVTNKTNRYSTAEFLLKHYSISYALSTNLLFHDTSANFLNRNISVISPEYKTYNNMPFSKSVLNQLRNNFELTDFAKKASNLSILHVSAHALCNQENSRNSFILVSDTNKLYLHNLSELKLNHKLAVLSACQTGDGKFEMGEGTINFSRHLYFTGIHSTISTLWKVDDEATASICKNFYNNLLKGQTSINSLHNAKLSFLNEAQSIDDYDPYYWAGLVYTGKDLILEEKKYDYLWLIVTGFLFLFGGITLIRKIFF